ncbi:MAG: hypothetical protein ABI877_22645, partial [Gemmatimonadaceae bacterium]
MRNRHFGEFWLGVVARGCEMAMRDRSFAKLSGAAFGGLDVRPLDIVSRMWAKAAGQVTTDSGRLATEIASGRLTSIPGMQDLGRWYTGWWGSLAEDPGFHGKWMADVMRKWIRLAGTTRLRDPRAQGPAHLRITPSRASS